MGPGVWAQGGGQLAGRRGGAMDYRRHLPVVVRVGRERLRRNHHAPRHPLVVGRVLLRAVVVARDVERREERVSMLVDARVGARDGAAGRVARAHLVGVWVRVGVGVGVRVRAGLGLGLGLGLADKGGELRGEVVAEGLRADWDLVSWLGRWGEG